MIDPEPEEDKQMAKKRKRKLRFWRRGDWIKEVHPQASSGHIKE